MDNIVESFLASSFTTSFNLHPINVHKSSDLPTSWIIADLVEMNIASREKFVTLASKISATQDVCAYAGTAKPIISH